jgi:O-antigen/teichoic acid export membrane protein
VIASAWAPISCRASGPSAALVALISLSRKARLPMLVLGFFAGEQIIVLAGGIQYQSFGFVIQGLSLLYAFIYFSQPIRILMRIHVLNKFFFMGYLLTLGFAMITSNSLISTWGLSGVISGLIVSQLLLIVYWYWILNRNKISVWKLFTSY